VASRPAPPDRGLRYDQTCCGQPTYDGGDRATARDIAAAFGGYDYIVVQSGSCGGMVRSHTPNLFDHDSLLGARVRALGDKTHELISFLTDVLGVRRVEAAFDAYATYHDGCSGLRELGIKQQPCRLLASIAGLTVTERAKRETCCGFGGTFCIKYHGISTRMVFDKPRDIAATGADTLLASDPGCLPDRAGWLAREGNPMRVRHVAEVLAGMTCGVRLGVATPSVTPPARNTALPAE